MNAYTIPIYIFAYGALMYLIYDVYNTRNGVHMISVWGGLQTFIF